MEKAIHGLAVFGGLCALFIAIHIPAIIWYNFSSRRTDWVKPWYVRYAPMELVCNKIEGV